jgi:uncharacterized membrane protein
MLKTKGTKFFIFAFLVIPVIHLLIFSYIPILSNVFLRLFLFDIFLFIC